MGRERGRKRQASTEDVIYAPPSRAHVPPSLSRDELPVVNGNDGPLAERHRHARDARVFMCEETHTYYVDRTGDGRFRTVPMSCSGVGKYFFREFKRHLIAGQIAKSAKQSEGDYAGLDKQGVLDNWEERRDAGTAMHALFFEFVSGLRVPPPTTAPGTSPEVRQYHQFADWMAQRRLRPFRGEWMLFDDALPLAGTADLLCVYEDQPNPHVLRLALIDYKRKVYKPEIKPRGRGRGPCAHLGDLDLVHYGLACNLYAEMLESNYTDFMYNGRVWPRLAIVYTGLAFFHPGQRNFEMLEVQREPTIRAIAKKALADKALQEQCDVGQDAKLSSFFAFLDEDRATAHVEHKD